MVDSIITALYLSIPILFSGALHMFVVSRDIFGITAIPIHKESFGSNKTWRGIFVMLALTIPGVYLAVFMEPLFGNQLKTTLSDSPLIILGLALGFGYVIPELPNSYIKRRLNIQPGERSDQHALIFTFVDQADSALGCTLVYWLLLSPPVDILFWMVVLGPLIHIIANLVLFSFGLRKQPI